MAACLKTTARSSARSTTAATFRQLWHDPQFWLVGGSDRQFQWNRKQCRRNINAGVISAGLDVYGSSVALTIQNSGTIGSISATISNGVNVGGLYASDSLTNSGVINTYLYLLGGGSSSVGAVLNTGTIINPEPLFAHVAIFDAGAATGLVVNGTGFESNALISGYDGVLLRGINETVVNFGTIVGSGYGSFAVELQGQYNRVVVEPAAVFVGSVVGNAGSGTSSVLELGAGPFGGTISATYRWNGDPGSRRCVSFNVIVTKRSGPIHFSLLRRGNAGPRRCCAGIGNTQRVRQRRQHDDRSGRPHRHERWFLGERPYRFGKRRRHDVTKFSGSYAAQNFVLKSDYHGGTNVTFV